MVFLSPCQFRGSPIPTASASAGVSSVQAAAAPNMPLALATMGSTSFESGEVSAERGLRDKLTSRTFRRSLEQNGKEWHHERCRAISLLDLASQSRGRKVIRHELDRRHRVLLRITKSTRRRGNSPDPSSEPCLVRSRSRGRPVAFTHPLAVGRSRAAWKDTRAEPPLQSIDSTNGAGGGNRTHTRGDPLGILSRVGVVVERDCIRSYRPESRTSTAPAETMRSHSNR